MVHPSLLPKFEQHKTAARQKRSASTAGLSQTPSLPKKAKLQTTLDTKRGGGVTQIAVEDLIIKYIVKEMLPLRTVEMPLFVELGSGLVPPQSVLCRKTLSVWINIKYASMLSDLKAQLTAVRQVCTSADIWSSHNKSYMGVTAHWIGESFECKSATLACRRLKGAHNYDGIAEVISEVHLPLNKRTSTVTDNTSNFAKAFKTFAAPEILNLNRMN